MKILFLETVEKQSADQKKFRADFKGPKMVRVDVDQVVFEPVSIAFNQVSNGQTNNDLEITSNRNSALTLATFAGQKVLFDGSPEDVRKLFLESIVGYKPKDAEALENMSMSRDDLSKKELAAVPAPKFPKL